jgi:type IV secretion system protein VirD4
VTGERRDAQGRERRAGVAAVTAAAVVVTWAGASAELAGRVGRGRWPHPSPDLALEILAALPAHLGHPGAPWPALRGVSTPLVAATAAATGVAAGLLGLVAAALWHRSVPARRTPRARPAGSGGLARVGPRRAAGGARWATRRDLRCLTVPGPVPGRLVIGRSRAGLVATEARQSVLVLGPTQTGKTTGLAVPAVLEWCGPVVATSVKGDLLADTLAWRARQGRCAVFDPTGASGVVGADPWSPLAEAHTWQRAQRVASWMVEATPGRAGLSDGAFWYAAAAKLLAPLLLAAARSDATMADVVRWTDLETYAEPAALLDAAGEAAAATALHACAARDDRIRSSVGTTLETVLAPFEDPEVARRTAGPPIDPAALLAGSHTLYLCGPSHEQSRVQGLFASLVAAVVAAAVERAAIGGPLDPPLLIVLDEVANIAPVRDLDTLASTGAGIGIQLVTVCQDLAQLSGRYGAERARTIANNHRAKLLLSGVSDLGTLDLLSGLAGEAAIREESWSSDLRDGRRTRSSTIAYRRLAPSDELRRTLPGEGVLVYGHLPAARIRLRPWFVDRRLRRRVRCAAEG